MQDDTPQAFFATPGLMTTLPDDPAVTGLPDDLEALRAAVQGLLLHRDWAGAYGVPPEKVRLDEQHLRSTTEVLNRAFELSPAPITESRPPIDRVLGICRHFTLVHTAFLRSFGVPARVRCGFGNYFDTSRWCDHWITERWDGDRWVREDPQIDDTQAGILELDFDPYDQPPGKFLTGAEAGIAARAGAIDPKTCGIFDMWGLAFIAGNVLSDIACLNKVELLPWDDWGIRSTWGPHDSLNDETLALVDELAALVAGDNFGQLRSRYLADDGVRVPDTISSYVDGTALTVHLR